MKLIKKSNQLLKIEFSMDELNLLDRVIDVPLSAFGLEQLLEKTKLNIDEIRLIKKKIDYLVEMKSFKATISYQEFINLKKIFKAACNVVDSQEIHPLTGYSWDDATRLQNAIENITLETKSS